MPVSVWIDCAAVLFGGLVGGRLRDHIPLRIRDPLNLIFGLCAIGIGVFSFIKLHSLPAVILSLVLGTLIGELINLDHKIKGLFRKVLHRLRFHVPEEEHDEYMSFYLIVTITFCASGTNIFGAMSEGMTGDMTILLSKAAMDIFAAMIFATVLGYAMNLIVIPQCVILSACFYLGRFIAPVVTPTMFADFLSVGGLMTFALGLSIAKIRQVNAANLLPALLLAMPISALFSLIPFG